MAKRLTLLALLAAVLAAVPGPHDAARAAFAGKNGRIVFVRSAGAGPLEEVFMVSPASGLTKNLSDDPATSDTAPAWSADGTRVAFQRSGPTEGIWTMDATGDDLAFVPHTDHGFQPTWSPDGDWIAFSRDGGGDAELWMVRADGSDLSQLTDNADEDREASWSPDGTRIAFSREGPGATTIIVVLALGGGEQPVTPAGGFDQPPTGRPTAPGSPSTGSCPARATASSPSPPAARRSPRSPSAAARPASTTSTRPGRRTGPGSPSPAAATRTTACRSTSTPSAWPAAAPPRSPAAGSRT